MVIFNSYVKLPEGIYIYIYDFFVFVCVCLTDESLESKECMEHFQLALASFRRILQFQFGNHTATC